MGREGGSQRRSVLVWLLGCAVMGRERGSWGEGRVTEVGPGVVTGVCCHGEGERVIGRREGNREGRSWCGYWGVLSGANWLAGPFYLNCILYGGSYVLCCPATRHQLWNSCQHMMKGGVFVCFNVLCPFALWLSLC